MNSAPSNPAVDPASSGSPSFRPLYQQIKALITQSLQAGEWKPGELMPSEVELAARFKVSQGTVRKAIDELAAENLVLRRQGKGTFVASHAEERAHFRFLRLMPDEGVPHHPENRFLEVKRIRAPAEVARLLDLKSGDAVVYIKRVQSFDGQPTILEELWLPGQLFKGLSAERLQEYKGPMYGLFETEFGTRMIRATEKIRAVSADATTAEHLKVAPGTPLLLGERVSFTYGDKAVELRRELYSTAKHHYLNELS
ncbi:GntR family transcriptional regulator [Massilia oculi]|jgi:GntR family transcriptional regulator|uniref:GntR family transcriptional regulator n=1 Tax=Massilia oculi TaxID=945844 RepID=A0A2S2DP57_9BURK|nr:GntR family transcriptional regulator [Massilia oculi]AWL06616.1 GntR family transcriptional regulator [Massilia oculi]